MRDVLKEVEGPLRRARAHRKAGAWDRALTELERAAEQLGAALKLPAPDDPAGRRRRTEIAHALSDCLAQKGGILRRKGDLHGARESYEQGRKIEQDPAYRIVDTYCLVNELVVSLLLRPEALIERREDLERARETSWEQSRGPRRKQWWAWADAGLMTALTSEDERAALDAYVEFSRTSARAEDYESSITVLEELREVLKNDYAHVARRLGRIIDEMRRHVRSALPRRSCFVLMPFGTKPHPSNQGKEIDFDAIYRETIRPAVEDADLEPIRADDDPIAGGLVHQAMIKRLRLSEFAIADLTTGNPNVLYELGVRHGSGAKSTLLLWSGEQRPPFDVAPYQYLPYEVGDDGRLSADAAERTRENIKSALTRMKELRQTHWSDNPIVQMFLEDGTSPEVVAHQKADLFREWVEYSEEWKRRLREARSLEPEQAAVERLEALERQLDPPGDQEPGVLMDLLLSYRHVGAWAQMIRLSDRLPADLRRSILVREQRALALNRRGEGNDRYEALAILETLNKQRESSETLGLTGRVYKDLWKESRSRSSLLAQAHLRKAIDAYERGFRADPRDTYPGINAVTLMDVGGHHDERDRLLPVVRFSAERDEGGDYWHHATLAELAVLGNQPGVAEESIGKALASSPERFALETTCGNLTMIADAREARGENVAWIRGLVEEIRRV